MGALTIDWGRDKTFTIPVLLNGAAVSLAGKTLRFLAKTATSVADASATITKNTASGIVHTDEAGGIATLTISATDTAALTPTESTTLLWECVLYPDNKLIDEGTLTVGPAVIRAAS